MGLQGPQGLLGRCIEQLQARPRDVTKEKRSPGKGLVGGTACYPPSHSPEVARTDSGVTNKSQRAGEFADVDSVDNGD